MPRSRAESGQASVELVALLPLVAVIAFGLWQAVVAGQAAWLAGSAVRAAARARALGENPERAAAELLPDRLRDGLRVDTPSAGTVRVHLPVPSVLGGERLATFTTSAHFTPQR